VSFLPFKAFGFSGAPPPGPASPSPLAQEEELDEIGSFFLKRKLEEEGGGVQAHFDGSFPEPSGVFTSFPEVS
jgi:hypothetical protein